MNTSSNAPAAFRADFGTRFSFDDFMWFVRQELATPEKETHQEERGRVDAYQVGVRRLMHPALKTFLQDLKGEGVLEPIPGGEGRSTTLLHAWNGMLAGFASTRQSDESWRTICGKFAHKLLFHPVNECAREIKNGKPEDVARDYYAKLVSAANKGDLHWFTNSSETCFVTGDELSCDVSGWKIRLGDVNDRRFVPVEPVARPAVIELEIELRTGNLIVTDWVRIKQFTDLVDGGKWGRRSLNAEMGREENTIRYAQEFGFISTSVPGCMPNLLDIAGILVVAEVSDVTSADEAAAGALPSGALVRDLGRIDTSYRGATLIERLVDLIAPVLGDDEAEREVERFIDGHDIISLNVGPGSWYLYFSGDYGGFSKRFQSKDISLPADVDPFCILSPRQLDVANKQEIRVGQTCAPSH
jgi:hypothetical protein